MGALLLLVSCLALVFSPSYTHVLFPTQDPSFRPFLQMVAAASPSLFSQACEHFRRARRLEQKEGDASNGEAERWLTLVSSSCAREK
jgi:hypothetical protein